MRSATLRSVLVLCAAIALGGASCTTSRPVNAQNEDLAQAARVIVGTSLIGARGQSDQDQAQIDDSVAGLCAAGSYTKTECASHSQITSGLP